MPVKRRTDWKRVSAQMGDEPSAPPRLPSTTGREVLAKGTRTSEGNEGKFVVPKTMDEVMAMLEANRKLHSMAKKKGSYRPGLKGLFGGGK